MAVPVSGLLPYTQISAGGYHSLAVPPEGEVRAWGFNWASQLGDGTTTDRSIPGPVPGLSNVVEVTAGYLSTIRVPSGCDTADGLTTRPWLSAFRPTTYLLISVPCLAAFLS